MSNRIVWPYVFTLQVSQQETPQVRTAGVAYEAAAANPGGALGLPVDLRWVTKPELGFPRQPFEVWRRARINIPTQDVVTLLSSPVQINGLSDIPFPANDAGMMYIVAFQVAPSSGNVLILAPYDLRGKTIPGVVFEASYAQTSYFVCPGMAGLRVVGEGTINTAAGVSQEVYANLPGWELIQIVGLPVTPADNLNPAYDSAAHQGYDIAPTTGLIAAEERMALSHIFLKQPQPSGDPTFPVPPWPASNPVQYLANLRSGTNLFPMIVKCLQGTNDANPAQMQSIYVETVNNLDGVFQANVPNAKKDPSQTSTVEIPVVQLSMLAVSTDSDAALALGYGTVDIPLLDEIAEILAYYKDIPRQYDKYLLDTLIALAALESRIPYDYMVTAPYVLPFGLTVNLAALSQPPIPVEAVNGFEANLLATHAVLTRDTGAEVAVELTWQPATQPQAAGILVSRESGQSNYLNTARPVPVRGYDPYVGLPPVSPPADASPYDLLPNLKDAAGTVPIDGSSTTRYLAAGLDVFGRWSAWTEAAISLSAPPVTVPGISKVSWIPGTLPSSGTKVPYSLAMEVLWNWTDRSPGSIAISGKFIPANTKLGPTAFLSGLEMNNDLPAGAPVVLSWDYTGFDPTTMSPTALLPTIDGAHTGSVVLLTDVSNVPNNQVIHYLVTISGFKLDYALSDELFLGLYVTATEHVRPGEWSSPIDPNAPPSPPAPDPAWIGRVVRAVNPLPPSVNFTPPAINWTALPDAYNLAHGVLSWGGTGAAGYMVWEATESALLQLLAPGTDPDPLTPLVTRGATLKSLVSNNFNASLQAFARLNTDPIKETSLEIEVPGNASVLYCYMVSAVSSQGVESTRTAANSPIAVFGVPQRVVPGQPRLRLRPQSNGIQVVALAIEGDVLAGKSIVSGYRVFRKRSAALAADAGLMGPPVYDEADSNWVPYTETPLRGGTVASGFAITDTAATPSWYPWYYRIQAIGTEDAANGKYSGKSLPSQVQSAYNTPPPPPAVVPFTLTQGQGAALVKLTSNLPIPPSPLGPALVELLKSAPDPAHPGQTIHTTILAKAPDAITKGTLALPTPWWTPPHPGPHPPYHPPFKGPALARSAPDSHEKFTLYILVPYASSDQNTYTVRLTDPLGRPCSFSF